MIFQFFLIATLAILFFYAISQRKRSFFVSVAIAVISLAGIGLALAPDMATEVAHLVGIGRGTDLIVYCFIVLILAAIFNIHLRLSAEVETTTELSRLIAILNAHRPKDGGGDS